jgi:small subunit ribosomal protein S18
MSEQVNPTAEEEEAVPAAVAETEAPEASAPEAPARPSNAPGAYVADDSEDEDEDEGDEESEEEDLYVEGPAEYVQREKSGRGRRIGNEVRAEDVDYKNIPMLSRFLDRRGRILSRRKTRVSAKVQRRIVQAIKRARHLALLPYTAEQTRIVRKRR